MSFSDLFVGSISILIGLLALVAAVIDWEVAYTFWAAKRVQNRWGRPAARLFYLVLSIALVTLGIAIILGLRGKLH